MAEASNKAKTDEEEEVELKEEQVKLDEPTKEMIDKLTEEMQELYKHKAQYKVNETGSVTFWPTPNCKPSSKKLPRSKINIAQFLPDQNCKRALTHSDPDTEIVTEQSKTCSFLVAALTAWREHYPFRFKPEHIWLLILQGVAVHVDKNAEKLRAKYVNHEDKKKLEIEISANPSRKEWQEVIEYFVQEIDKYTVEDTCKLFECDYSTSTLTERIAAKVTIMDICKNYFDYYCEFCCGFPEITIDGTKQDWIKLKQKTEQLLASKVDKKFGEQWGKALLPLLDRFIAAFEGNIDCVFWNSMIKRGATGGSGAFSYYCGWLNILFPFLKERENYYCVPYSMEREYVKQGFVLEARGGSGGRVTDYPTGLASAPVTWNKMGQIIKLKFLAGFIGFQQDAKTLEICPNIGWCIAEEMSKEEIKKRTHKSDSDEESTAHDQSED
eukprot:CAMPEP_0197077568 /NCGR_PEP_ID=MMETSP1384-20130603/212682_1 /TAXON_ID=29189 /ORGANISM="Ammonia sp." /LENGTH=439 /DNA_ID=CAMNT_0042516433 /DNA_START=81 /DNA_END=1400 /DNA_ORIENTATION=+